MPDVDCTGKVCGRCKIFKEESQFGRVNGKIRSYCRECHSAANLVPDLRAEKKCACCGEVKPVSEFSANGKRYQSHCRECGNKRMRTIRAAQKESGESVLIDRADYFKRRKWVKLKAVYGIKREDYEKMVAAQNNACAICLKPETEMLRNSIVGLSVDHDHTTGKVRGLLCKSCNVGIGNLKESVEILRSAIIYLEKHK